MSDGYARVHKTWEYRIEDFSTEEFEKTSEAVAEWAKENLITPYQLQKTSKGFEITMGSFCETGGRGLACDLFKTLCRQVFREMKKSVAYGEKIN